MTTLRLAVTTCALALALAVPATAEEKKASDAKTDPAIAKIDEFIAAQKIDKSKPDWKQHLPKPPQVTFGKDKKYVWVLETNKGTMKITLKPDVAPMHVSST